MTAKLPIGMESHDIDGSFQDVYVLGEQLGKGSQGSVCACTDKATGESLAVKMLDRTHRHTLNTYVRELELSKAGASDHVIRILADFVDSRFCYIIMPQYAGHLRNALEWIANQRRAPAALPAPGLKRLMRHTCDAVAHLHSCNIVHRDVKAKNVFLSCLDTCDPSCHIVLGDFGLAHRLEKGYVLSAQVGTRKYWAPELYDRRYWHLVDVFAIGVTLFLAASRRYPYAGEEQTRACNVFKENMVPTSLEDMARSFLAQALEKQPAKRICAAKLAAHPWLPVSVPSFRESAKKLTEEPSESTEAIGQQEVLAQQADVLIISGKGFDVKDEGQPAVEEADMPGEVSWWWKISCQAESQPCPLTSSLEGTVTSL